MGRGPGLCPGKGTRLQGGACFMLWQNSKDQYGWGQALGTRKEGVGGRSSRASSCGFQGGWTWDFIPSRAGSCRTKRDTESDSRLKRSRWCPVEVDGRGERRPVRRVWQWVWWGTDSKALTASPDGVRPDGLRCWYILPKSRHDLPWALDAKGMNWQWLAGGWQSRWENRAFT